MGKIDGPQIGPETVTIEQIARNLDMSIATVSRAMNGRKRVSQESKRRVLLEARRLNYRPKMQAPTHTLGLITLLPQNYVAQVDSAIIREFSSFGWVIEAFSLERLEVLLDRLVDGLVVQPNLGQQMGKYSVGEILDHMANTPIVLFNQPGQGKHHAVLSDHFQGGYLAGRRLAEAGHTRIAVVCATSGNREPWDADARRDGVRRALQQFGTDLSDDLVFYGRTVDMESLIEQALAKSPTALFLGNEYMTPIGISLLQGKYRLRIPEDISVIGFDAEPETPRFFPKLTTIEQPLDQMAHKSLEIIERVMRNTALPYETLVFPNRLVEGDSVANIRKTQ